MVTGNRDYTAGGISDVAEKLEQVGSSCTNS